MVPVKPDWNRLIIDLMKTGLRHEDIAKKVGCSASAISTIKNHVCNDVRFSIGASILNFHAKVCGDGTNKTETGKLGTLGTGQGNTPPLPELGASLSQPARVGGLGTCCARSNPAAHRHP
jgi:hypothetical protein